MLIFDINQTPPAVQRIACTKQRASRWARYCKLAAFGGLAVLLALNFTDYFDEQNQFGVVGVAGLLIAMMTSWTYAMHLNKIADELEPISIEQICRTFLD